MAANPRLAKLAKIADAVVKTCERADALAARRADAEKDTQKVEAYGVKGMKATPWRKTFANAAALDKWCNDNDSVEVYGQRDAD